MEIARKRESEQAVCWDAEKQGGRGRIEDGRKGMNELEWR